MWYSIFKAVFSGAIIAIVSEVAKRSPALGALIVSLPIISILAMIWLWHDTDGDFERIALHSQATFWFVLPSLPMFLVLPYLLRSGVHFYWSMALSCLLTIILYFLMIFILKRFGLNLL